MQVAIFRRKFLSLVILALSVLPLFAGEPSPELSSSSGRGKKRKAEALLSTVIASLDDAENHEQTKQPRQAPSPNFWKFDAEGTKRKQTMIGVLPSRQETWPARFEITQRTQHLQAVLVPLLHLDLIPCIVAYAVGITGVGMVQCRESDDKLRNSFSVIDVREEDVEMVEWSNRIVHGGRPWLAKTSLNIKRDKCSLYQQAICGEFVDPAIGIAPHAERLHRVLADNQINVFSLQSGKQCGSPFNKEMIASAYYSHSLQGDAYNRAYALLRRYGMVEKIPKEPKDLFPPELQEALRPRFVVQDIDPGGHVMLMQQRGSFCYAVHLKNSSVVRLDRFLMPNKWLSKSKFSANGKYAAIGNQVFDLETGQFKAELPSSPYYFDYPQWRCFNGQTMTDQSGRSRRLFDSTVMYYSVDTENPRMGSLIVHHKEQNTHIFEMIHPDAEGDSVVPLITLPATTPQGEPVEVDSVSSMISRDGRRLALIVNHVLCACDLR